MKKRIECEIYGRVQLVMFRDFAQRKAKKRGLTGTVENMKNGNVYVIAEGEEKELNDFLEDLHKGPLFSKVTNVEVKMLDAKGGFNDFSIIFYGNR
ncbi:MAG: acylphosphatase [Patescibacteria group bacterium]